MFSKYMTKNEQPKISDFKQGGEGSSFGMDGLVIGDNTSDS